MKRMKWSLCVAGAVCMLGAATVGIVARAAESPKDAKYVGTKKCQACHMKDYKTWQKTKHSTVFAQLQGDEAKNPECVKCHVTGYGKEGGFTTAEATPGLENVGCEACHGPGSAHVEAAPNAPEKGEWDKKISKVPQNVCINCHNPHVDRKDLAEKYRAEHKK